MIHTGTLLHMELYDDMTPPYTNVRAVWGARHSRHPGRCIVTNAHWYDPGPKQCGNYKVGGVVLSNQWPDAVTGFGWNTGEPQWTSHMDNYENFICSIPALINGERQNLSYGAGVERATTRTWFGRKADGEWAVEVTTTNYTLDGIVDRMEDFGIVDGMVLDGSGSSQWYDGETRLSGDGRVVFSYLILWFDEDATEPEEPEESGESGFTPKFGVDVSDWQGEIDWEAAKAAGVQFAMIKAGSGQSGSEDTFRYNADECTRLGIPFGVYFFSYAYNTDFARKEARRCLEMVRGYKLSYPIAWDYEYASYDYNVSVGVTPTRSLVSDMARAFLEEIEAAGYYAALYANPDYINRYFDARLINRYDIWLAQWQGNDKRPEDKPPMAGGMWQYSNQGHIDGIPERVDLDYAYYDYPAIIGQPAEPEPEPEPEEPEKEDKPMTWQEEQQAATEWVKETGISDGERPEDAVKRVELWVTLWRMFGGEK